MSKIGRNQPCPCGSRKKYKRCHGALARRESILLNPELQAAIDQRIKGSEALHVRRRQQQGLGRPIIAAKLKDHQFVAVGNRVHYSAQWRTFHDFLRDFLFGLLGKEWLNSEYAKQAANRHTGFCDGSKAP
jgi:SEC-C motif